MSPSSAWSNWGRNQRATPSAVLRPASIGELASAVAAAARNGRTVRPVGSGHSFSDIAVPVDLQLDLADLRGLVSVDADRRRATFLAGTTLNEIPELLAPHGLAMQNLGDIDRQTLAGAISTGTHGSGLGFGGLSTQVAAVALVTAEGELLRVDMDDDPDLLRAVALSLGALGVLVEITLTCVPAFALDASEHNEPLDLVLGELLERGRQADHLDVYWFPHTEAALVKVNTRLAPGAATEPPSRARKWFDDELLGNGAYGLLCRLGHAAPELVPRINRIASGAVAQRRYSDASHRVLVTNRSVRFVEQEYAMPAEHLAEAVGRVRSLIDRHGWKISFPIELRFAAADDLWLSTAHGRDSGYLAVHRYFREPFHEYFAAVEEICVALGGRPHWGKFHTQTADNLRRSYPRFAEFVALRDRLDPDRVFSNGYLDRVLGA